MPKKIIRKAASVLNAAMKDADLARRTAHDPAFQREILADRRAALSRYTTVQHALRDRAVSAKEDRAGTPAKAGTPARPAKAIKAATPGKAKPGKVKTHNTAPDRKRKAT